MKHKIYPISVVSLDKPYIGDPNYIVEYITSLTYSDETTISYYKGDNPEKIANIVAGILIVKEELKNNILNYKARTIIFVSDPVLFWARILSSNFENSFIDKNPTVNSSKTISTNSFVEEGSTIGSKTKIYPNTTILKSTIIGKNCVIQSGSVLGGLGMSYVKDEVNQYFKIVQLGMLDIEDNVDIGCNCSILRGIMEPTKIGQGSKIGNNVNIGHNVVVGNNCYISSGVTIGGACTIGDNSWISPGVTITDHIAVGPNSKIGTGSVIIKDVLGNSFYLGNPARKIKDI